jgi:N-acetylmuramoyl-L-alanine amidase
VPRRLNRAAAPPVQIDHLSYATRLALRSLESVDLIVIHCTELPDLATARSFGERILYQDSGTGNSGHYYIERDGRVHEWVAPERIAHHVRNYNERSVGIELVNRGRYPDWFDSRRQSLREPYPQAQIEALNGLLCTLTKVLSALRWIAGHDELDTAIVPASDNPHCTVRRKVDPGPLFPWADVVPGSGLARLS